MKKIVQNDIFSFLFRYTQFPLAAFSFVSCFFFLFFLTWVT